MERRFHTKDSGFTRYIWCGHKPQTAKLFVNAGIKEEKMNDFLNAMGYINTRGDKQKVKTFSEWIHDGMKLL